MEGNIERNASLDGDVDLPLLVSKKIASRYAATEDERHLVRPMIARRRLVDDQRAAHRFAGAFASFLAHPERLPHCGDAAMLRLARDMDFRLATCIASVVGSGVVEKDCRRAIGRHCARFCCEDGYSTGENGD